MSDNKKGDWTKRIGQLTINHRYILFFVISYLSIYFSYIQGGKLYQGHDSDFHLSRIEALYIAISNGDFFPQITYFLAKGMGYASSIFYSDIFLYPAALLRLIGFPLGLSYVFYILLVTFFTFVIAYHSFHSITYDKKKSLIFSLLYGLSSYRIADVVTRGALGEVLALMVLPIAFAGMIQIISGDEKKFYILSIGMASLFISHIISTVIFCLFIIGYLILNIKTLIKDRKRVLYLFYATVLTLLMVAVSVLPIIEQLTFQQLKVQSEQIFYLQKSAENLVDYLKSAILNQGYNNLGWLIIVALLVLLIRIRSLTTQNKQFLVLGIVFLFLATDYFPHYLFQDTVFNAIQFPWRYFIIITLCITWALADSFEDILPQKKNTQVVVISCTIFLLLFSSIQYQITGRKDVRFDYDYFSQLDGFNLGAGMEYLPSDMDYVKTLNEISGIFTRSKEAEISKATRNYNELSFIYRVEKPTKVTFPIIYYKGYDVQLTGSGEISKVEESQEFKGLCEVTVSGEGRVRFWYKGTMIQKVSLGISLLTWLSLAGYLIDKRKKKSAG
ncbi:hypothetical protein ACWOC1_03245 [Enterococcus quebecensis]|uniref:Membrane protein 6-pyruvoyl-tetrahydropterin synthase-related domain-containing protein n=1 Tax=Enterococcus quebecensis TaxID=903983 RepID=A0A1E5GR72_9ENTE|nr:hypothetical protein [Enterococcus quebecensis]OEG15203.1 hypothetical protein BCR23_10225 [Enterococcus quebecensis]OJG74782.1 hypothetical protein RV12_GL002199 [Enterococcus quebecensis]